MDINSSTFKQDQFQRDSSTGRTVVRSGFGSHLIQAIEFKNQEALKRPLQKLITNRENIEDYGNVKEALDKIKTAAGTMCSKSIAATIYSDLGQTGVFAEKLLTVTNSESQITGSASPSASKSSYSIEVLQKAKRDTLTAGTVTAYDHTAALGWDCTLSFNSLKDATDNVDIVVNTSHSLNSVIQKINYYTKQHGLTAAKVRIDEGWALRLQAKDYGDIINFDTTWNGTNYDTLLPSMPIDGDIFTQRQDFLTNNPGYKDSISATDTVSSKSTALGWDIALKFANTTNETIDVNVNVTSGMTLNDIVTAINAQNSTHGYTASIVDEKVKGVTEYKIRYKADDNDRAIKFESAWTGGSDAQKRQIPRIDDVRKRNLNAVLIIDEAIAYSDSNKDTTSLPDITLNLANANINEKTAIVIDHHQEQMTESIQNFMDQFNEFMSLFDKLHEKIPKLDDNDEEIKDPDTGESIMVEKYNIVNSSIIKNMESKVKAHLNALFDKVYSLDKEKLKYVTASDGTKQFAFNGVILTSKHRLEFDSSELAKALSNDPEDVANIFQFHSEVTDGDPEIVCYDPPNSSLVNSIKVNWSRSGATYACNVVYNGTTYTMKSNDGPNIVILEADKDDPIAGLKLVITAGSLPDGANRSCDMELKSGLGVRLEKVSDEVTALIQKELIELQEKKEPLQKELQKVQADNIKRVGREQNKISSMQAKLQELRSVGAMIDMFTKKGDK